METDPLALQNQVCFSLAVAARTVIGLYRPVLEPLGLTHPQYLVMLALWERSPRSLADLGSALRLEPATLSPLVKRLEASGHVTRARSSDDERRLDVALTPSGAALREQALQVPPQIVERLDVPLEELIALRDSLTGLIGAATRDGR
ncbi:MarR family transcriptional regulator [Rathayibacter sp. AY1E8]|uniref:MarR family winged helix-turn-helix transcriptional regulator n=1 Tax=unclassified Rathayibacter TaxID=2609250 RepID=UPI000CE9193E|nr:MULTISPECIES: MarR family transcriptional regulator [unclassified Rathayibacter]PPG18770.1 MarR family transcriptional regulator [Rathayibacter sp. AY1E8]PPH16278.1 MarR family transcriptional regulator [Rathayibacter sp. AY1F8]PPH20082.1 MarR family transcriptional regulator [Rathayibacter sp. AY1C4]PPH45224.1 MarR family transcriptional regulator [Rathayibacter sp. AY1C9]PPH73968.1 MarR family transcriptional regulator [Rathayibacter sp. AY1D4]